MEKCVNSVILVIKQARKESRAEETISKITGPMRPTLDLDLLKAELEKLNRNFRELNLALNEVVDESLRILKYPN
jgi:hypothetical protein